MDLPRRLRRLPPAQLTPQPLLASLDVRCARGPLARLLGLAGTRDLPQHVGLLLPHTRSVHTFGMRFALDLVWLDGAEGVVRIDRDVPPRRLRACRDARAVVELAAAPARHPAAATRPAADA